MEHEEDSDLERIEQADDDENDEWNDAPFFSTPRHHKHRNCNSTRLLHLMPMLQLVRFGGSELPIWQLGSKLLIVT